MTLDRLEIGKSAKIKKVGGKGALREHFLDMGLTPNTEVKLVKTAPMGDPIEVCIRGYELTLRKEEAKKIELGASYIIEEVNQIEKKELKDDEIKLSEFDNKTIKIAENQKIRFALAGNQNCGKTTLFNQLTGANQHVGNFPGVTVDRKDGIIRNYPNVEITDLPGIYSMSPYTSEEIVSRDFVLKNHPDGIINIVDATNIERNLYLTMQLIELNIPIILALNMMDEVYENGGAIMINKLENLLGIPVVPISASKNQGVDELIEKATEVVRYGIIPKRQDFCNHDGGKIESALHRCIHAIMHLIEDHSSKAKIPIRFAATKLIEKDKIIEKDLKIDENEKEILEHILVQLENESGTDREAALADMRYTFIERICQKTVVKPQESKNHIRSIKIDKIFTGKYTAIPTFLIIMGLIFWLTFGVIGGTLSNILSNGIDNITQIVDNLLNAYQINEVVHSLIIDGIFAGVGSVLSFLPIIVVLFFFLSILEDTGYMARVSFVMDKLLRKIGLSGRSFVPMLIGFGCSVPAIMSTRTLSSQRDRKMTILLTPFMSCSAKLPIYALFTAVFFKEHQTLVMFLIYIIGIVVGILFALFLKEQKIFKGNPIPFVLELPNYRIPNAKTVCQLIWEKTKGFVTKAFTIIFLASLIIWFLQTFDIRFNLVTDSQNSLLAGIGNMISPIFTPLGFSDWRVSTALITGFTAKESVVSTLTVLLGDASKISELFTPLTAFVFLVFTLLYTPCIAAIATVKKELGKRWALIVIISQCIIAWCVAFGVHTIGMIFGIK